MLVRIPPGTFIAPPSPAGVGSAYHRSNVFVSARGRGRPQGRTGEWANRCAGVKTGAHVIGRFKNVFVFFWAVGQGQRQSTRAPSICGVRLTGCRDPYRAGRPWSQHRHITVTAPSAGCQDPYTRPGCCWLTRAAAPRSTLAAASRSIHRGT